MKNLVKNFVLKSIVFYQKFLSPMKKPCCRFVPTCSEYARVAVERFGVCKGLFLAFKRILRCNPFCKGGCDFVPEKNKFN